MITEITPDTRSVRGTIAAVTTVVLTEIVPGTTRRVRSTIAAVMTEIRTEILAGNIRRVRSTIATGRDSYESLKC